MRKPTLHAIALAMLVSGATSSHAATSADYNIYWGDLHGHTMDSPVTLTPQTITNYILEARDVAQLDFVALSEKDFDITDADWNELRSQATSFTSTGSFVAFSAYEWGDDGFHDFGHRPVYYATDDQPLFRSDVPTSDHVSELLDKVTTLTNGMTAVAHPDLSNFSTDWDYFDGLTDRLTEIYSRHGFFESGDKGVQQALALGYRFGFSAVSDTRDGTPGSHGLTAVLTTSLRKSRLIEAMRARRTYATTGARIGLWFAADGHPMGEEYAASSGPSLTVECTPTAPLDRIEVLKNNSVVYTWFPPSKTLLPPTRVERTPEPATLQDVAWTKPGYRPAGWEEGALGDLEAPVRGRTPRRLRLSWTFDQVPEHPVLIARPRGTYRIFVNGTVLVDSRRFVIDPPSRQHDCFAPDAHGLAGTPQEFAKLGFFHLQRLGATLRAGENTLAIELGADGELGDEPVRLMAAAAAPVQFTWGDNAFTGSAFYYVRVIQTDGEMAWASPIWVDRMAPDTTPPQAVTKLRANKDGRDVFLDWPKVAKDRDGNLEKLAFYRVFRGTSRDFVPDRTTLTNQIATPTRSRYRDSNALDAGVDYYYRVFAVDDAGNESETASNLAYVLHVPLTFNASVGNLHWLSIPWEAIYSNADEFVRDLNGGATGACTKVVRWDVGQQQPLSWVELAGQWAGTNFVLVPGEAVAVAIRSDFDAVLVGAHDAGAAVRLTPNPTPGSLNWISVPHSATYFFASSLANDINQGPFATVVKRVVRWTPGQTLQSYTWSGSSWSGTNFVVMPGEAYGFEVQAPYDWVPQTND